MKKHKLYPTSAIMFILFKNLQSVKIDQLQFVDND